MDFVEEIEVGVMVDSVGGCEFVEFVESCFECF